MSFGPGDLEPLDGVAPLGVPVASDLAPALRSPGLIQSVKWGDVQSFVTNSVKAFGAVGDGVTDDTGAIQSAINGGAPFYFPAGVYLISSTLVFNAAANHGQVARGAGPTAGDGTGNAKAVIRPGSGVSVAILIDGTPFNSYVQGLGLQDVTIDMVNMVDAVGSIAVKQVQAFDIAYSNVRVINYGVYKTSFQFNAGAFTSKLNHCQFGSVLFNGISLSNAATTITFHNCDFLSVGGNYHAGVSFIGGACQQPYTAAVPITYLPPGTSPYAYLPNTAGLYVAALSTLQNCNSFTSIGTDWEQGGGFPATYNDGMHGTLTLIRVLMVASTAQNSAFINPTFAGMYMLDMSNSSSIDGQNIGVGGGDIRTRQLYYLSGVNVSGVIQGFSDLPNYLNTNSTKTFSINGSTGNASFNKTTISPAADGDQILSIKTAAGLPIYDFTTNGAGFALLSGTLISGYTDSFTTQSWIIDSGAGSAKFRTLNVNPSIDGNSVILWKNAAGVVLLGFNTNTTPSSSSLYLENGISLDGFSDSGATQTWSASGATGNIAARSIQIGPTPPPAGGISTNGQLRTVGVTFASLPAPGLIGNGTRGFITDGTLSAAGNYGTAITAGGGTNQTPVYSDGTNWRIG